MVEDALSKLDINESFTILPPRNLHDIRILSDDPAINKQYLLLDGLICNIIDAEKILADARIRLQSHQHAIDAALSPINLLPPEVMRIVFSFCIQEGLHQCDFEVRTISNTLASVSRRWRYIAIAQRELWSYVNTQWRSELLDCWSSRVGSDGFGIVQFDTHDSTFDFYDSLDTIAGCRALDLYFDFQEAEDLDQGPDGEHVGDIARKLEGLGHDSLEDIRIHGSKESRISVDRLISAIISRGLKRYA